MTDEDVWEYLGRQRIKFWACPIDSHRYVTWDGPVATCDTCGRSNRPAPEPEPAP